MAPQLQLHLNKSYCNVFVIFTKYGYLLSFQILKRSLLLPHFDERLGLSRLRVLSLI